MSSLIDIKEQRRHTRIRTPAPMLLCLSAKGELFFEAPSAEAAGDAEDVGDPQVDEVAQLRQRRRRRHLRRRRRRQLRILRQGRNSVDTSSIQGGWVQAQVGIVLSRY